MIRDAPPNGVREPPRGCAKCTSVQQLPQMQIMPLYLQGTFRPRLGRIRGGYGRRGGRPPRRRFRTRRESFPSSAPQYTSLCHRHSIGGDYSPPELGICTVRVGLASGLQYARMHGPTVVKVRDWPVSLPLPPIPRVTRFRVNGSHQRVLGTLHLWTES